MRDVFFFVSNLIYNFFQLLPIYPTHPISLEFSSFCGSNVVMMIRVHTNVPIYIIQKIYTLYSVLRMKILFRCKYSCTTKVIN
jgi:hypothetical protein